MRHLVLCLLLLLASKVAAHGILTEEKKAELDQKINEKWMALLEKEFDYSLFKCDCIYPSVKINSSFFISYDGTISSPKITKSSGCKWADKFAAKAINYMPELDLGNSAYFDPQKYNYEFDYGKSLNIIKKKYFAKYPVKAYMMKLQRLIKEKWQPPKRTKDYRAVVTFFVLKDGSVKDLKLIQASGSDKFDQSSLAAINAVGKFDTLNDDLISEIESTYKDENIADKGLHIEFTFDYSVFDKKPKKQQLAKDKK